MSKNNRNKAHVVKKVEATNETLTSRAGINLFTSICMQSRSSP
ncbi:hypothetical protein [Desulfonatronum parangueonense]